MWRRARRVCDTDSWLVDLDDSIRGQKRSWGKSAWSLITHCLCIRVVVAQWKAKMYMSCVAWLTSGHGRASYALSGATFPLLYHHLILSCRQPIQTLTSQNAQSTPSKGTALCMARNITLEHAHARTLLLCRQKRCRAGAGSSNVPFLLQFTITHTISTWYSHAD